MTKNNVVLPSITWGSDADFFVTWKGVDLTGYTVDLVDVSTAIADMMSASLSDAANGVVKVSIDGSEPPEPNIGYNFRVRITLDDRSTTTPKFVFQLI